jgi:enediyne biosynthesis protein E4
LAFIDATERAGLSGFRHDNGAAGNRWFPETMGAGAGMVDVDQDGWLDILLLTGGGWEESQDRPLRVYINQRDGSFVRSGEAEPTGLRGTGFGLAAADIDNDGDTDLYYSALGQDALLRNNGGHFVPESIDDAGPVSAASDRAWSTAATFFDADNDGWVDLYVGRYVQWTAETDIFCSQDGQNKGYCTPEMYPGEQGAFYLNRGDGTFRKEGSAGFESSNGKTLGAITLDYNRDGRVDLMLANDTEPDELYLNRGDGTFREIGLLSGIAFDERGRARAGMGVAAGVVDQSGQETLFVGNFSSEMIGVYRHMGNDVFLDRAASSRIGQPSLLTLSFGLALADFDLDGDLDLFTANGHVQPEIGSVKESIQFREPPHLFRNEGDGTFTDVAAQAGLAGAWVARAAVSGDYDHDGDVDLLVTENGGGVHLLKNNAAPGASIRVELEGTLSNRSAIGADIQLWVRGRMQRRFVRSGGGYLSQSSFASIFGLGQASEADSLVIRWPSGVVTRRAAIAAGSRLRIVEGD